MVNVVHDTLHYSFGMRIFFKMKVVWTVCVLLFIGGGVVWYVTELNGPMNRATVITTEHQRFVVATGNIEARSDVLLAFERNGRVLRMLREAGEKVSAGDAIAVLDEGDLSAQTEAQRAQVEKAIIRLNSFVDGPEYLERVRIRADSALSLQTLKNETSVALVSAQQSAGALESLVRRTVDVLFTGIPENPRLASEVSIPVIETDKINRARGQLESVFTRWRLWANTTTTDSADVADILIQFEKDLRSVYDIIAVIYDITLPLRSFAGENEKIFTVIMDIRREVLAALVNTTKGLNTVRTAHMQHRLKLAQSEENLAGGTEVDRETQRAQVETEQEQLHRLELQREKTRLRAPFTGIIGEVFVSAGEFVVSGTDAVRLISEGGFDLSVNVTEIEVQNLTLGQTMEAKIEATDEVMPVRIRTIDPTEKLVSDVPVYTVVLDVMTDSRLRPGLTVDVFIPSGEKQRVLAVPTEAVSDTRTKKAALTVERNKKEERVPVRKGALLDGGLVIVEGDINVGETVLFRREEE